MVRSNKLGERIRSARKARNLSLRKLGELIDFSPTSINRIEKGERGLSSENFSFVNLIKLSNELSIPVSELVSLAVEYETK